jgi:hypothetical protein
VSLMVWILVLWFGVTLPTAAVIALLAFYDGHHRPSSARGRFGFARRAAVQRPSARRTLVFTSPRNRG